MNQEMRKGDWIQTFTGRQFWPLDPRVEDVSLYDIAHALSMQCRYGGHVKHFYSVAEHCVILSHAVPEHLALEALMHDAAEAYLVDLPRPIKKSCEWYYEIERGIEQVVMPYFGLPWPISPEVMVYDTRILTDERQQLMAKPPIKWGTDMEPLGITVHNWEPLRAEVEFMGRFAELDMKRSALPVQYA
jgi:uncharacterized protein